jgi:hypothetical protein
MAKGHNVSVSWNLPIDDGEKSHRFKPASGTLGRNTGDRYYGSSALALLHDCAARETRGAASINQGE